MKKIYLFTNIAPHYRLATWTALKNLEDIDIQIFSSQNSSLGIKEMSYNVSEIENIFQVIKGIWVNKRILIWQRGVLNKCLFTNYDLIILLGDMYCISNWVAAVICKLRGKKVAFWGHGIYGRESFLKMKIRVLFNKLADKHLIYERRAKSLLVEKGIKSNNIYVVFNSLDYKSQFKLRVKYKGINKKKAFGFPNVVIPVIIFIGRLTKQKKIDLLIRAVNMINVNEVRVNLVIIGGGSEREVLEKIGGEGLKDNWLKFVGASYNEEQNARYLMAADLCISPGNVGLTCIHSLTYGTPVATHNDMTNQGPEAEVIIDGYNGFLFTPDDEIELSNKIIDWFETQKDSKVLFENCVSIVDNYYNPDYQASVFKRLIYSLPPRI